MRIPAFLFIKNIVSKPNQGTDDNHRKEDSDEFIAFVYGQFGTNPTAKSIAESHGDRNGPNDFTFQYQQANRTKIGREVDHFGIGGSIQEIKAHQGNEELRPETSGSGQ